jgi:hypothetical protein
VTLSKPKWPTTAADEAAFKAYIFAELDRRISAQTAAMADEAQRPENVAMFLEMIAAGWAPPTPPKHGRGRPPVGVERQFVPAEAAARMAELIVQIALEEYHRRNLMRPSPAELAAEYLGLDLKAVAVRRKRGKDRRPV